MGKGSSSRLSRCLKAPVRALCSVRDWYVKGVTACAGQVGQYGGAGISYPSFSDFTYSNSFSSSSSSSSRSDCLDSEDGLRQLIRAVSKARHADAAKPSVGGVRRSQSAVVGRIDEDQPCEFKEDNVKVGSSLLFPRSSSHGVGKRRGSNVFA